MFGVDDNHQQSNDDPAMLDNVKQLASQPVDQVVPAAPAPDEPAAQTAPAPTPAPDPAPTPEPAQDEAPTPASAPEPESSPALTPFTPSVPPAPSADTAVAEPVQNFTNTPTNNEDKPAEEPAPAPAPEPEQEKVEEAVEPKPEPLNLQPTEAPAPVTATDETVPAPEPQAPADSGSSNEPDHDKLAGIKKEAIEHLESMTGIEDASNPEDSFKSTMMLIQANDNHGLLEKAFDTAKKIEDDKQRAQALLEIINEINYFSPDKK